MQAYNVLIAVYILNEKYIVQIVQWKIPLISFVKLYNNIERSDSCIRQH